MNCEEVEELIGAYALGALPRDALSEIGEHLVSCTKHPEAADLRAVAASLAFAAPEHEPPPALKSRLMQAIRAETAEPSAFRRRPGPLDWFQRVLSSRPLPYALAAALAVALLAVVVTNDGGRDDTMVAVFRDGELDHGRITYVPEAGYAVLQVHGLEGLPADQTYQIWAIRDDRPRSIGFLDDPGQGDVLTLVTATLDDGDVVAVTIEPQGGSPQPTSPPLVTARL